MTAQIKVKVQRKNIVKFKMLPRFPSGVMGDGAIVVSLSNGNYTVSLAPDFLSGLGNIVGPLSSTDNAIPRFDGTGGKIIQGSTVTLNDAGAFSGLVLASGATSFSWAAPAADAGIDFGGGTTITRRSVDGHLRLTSQNGIIELPAGHTLAIGTTAPATGAGLEIDSGSLNLAITNPTMTVLCPTFADFVTTNKAGVSFYQTMSAYGAGSELNSALLVQNIVPSTTTGSGAAGGIAGGFVNGKDGTDAYGVLGIVNNQQATVTAPSGAGVWGLIRGDLGGFSGIGFIDGLRTTSEVSTIGGTALAAVTISLASPGVVTYAAHLLIANQQIMFSDGGSGVLPAALSFGTLYYVKTVLTVNTFTVSLTKGGAAINTATASTGTINIHSPQRPRAGMFVNNNLYSNPFLSGAYVEGAVEYGFRVGSGNNTTNVWEPTYPFGYVRKGGSSPSFFVDTAAAVNTPALKVTSASGFLTWSSFAADAGIDFGGGYPGGSTITRRAADGHLAFTSQNGVFSFGLSGSAGSLQIGNATSGTVTLQPVAGALGSAVLTIPAATDTLVARNTAETLTNKTINTASNTFTVNGVSLDTAWTSYTPIITSASGAFTTVSATGFYKQIGKTVLFRIEISITTNGTAAGKIRATLPVAVSGTISQALSGFNSSTGAVLSAGISPVDSTTQASVFNATAGYPGANNTVLNVQGVYEVP